MKQIEGVNLDELIQEVSEGLLGERRDQAAGLIKQQLQRMEQLAIDLKKLNKETKKKEEKIAKGQEKLDKIKGGDWAVLTELQNQNQKNKGDKETDKYNDN